MAQTSVLIHPDAGPPPAPAWVARHTFRDADEQASLLDTLDQRYDQLTAGRYRGGLLEVRVDGLELYRESVEQCVQQQGSARGDCWTFATALQLSAPGYWHGDSVTDSTVICFEPEREFLLRTPKVSECVGVCVPHRRLRSFLAGVWNRDPEDWLRGRVVATRDPLRQGRLRDSLVQALDVASHAIGTPDNGWTGSLLAESVLQQLADALEPPSAAAMTPPGARHARLAQRARDYIETHVDQPFTVADLCRGVGCSRRNLQYAFETVFGTNPVAYIRALRLNAVRRELKRGGASVQDAAMRWGFWHLPRFARAYADMFDELPSITLRRGGAAAAGH